MPMPPQLARAKRPRRSTPRPLVEELSRLEIADLCRYGAFPSQYEWNVSYLLELPFRYPFLKNLVISLQNIEANHHTGYTQTIPLRWLRTGFGGNSRPRPLFICNCGRSVTKLYFKTGHLACRRCQSAVYASQVCDKCTRPVLQAQKAMVSKAQGPNWNVEKHTTTPAARHSTKQRTQQQTSRSPLNTATAKQP